MKTVLITGASKGIGKEAAFLFQKNGWNVAAAMRQPESETALAKLENVRCYRLDVTNNDSVRGLIQSVVNDYGSIDVLVNNAGVYSTKPLEFTSEDDVNSVIDTNIIGTIHMIQAVLPHFRSRKQGTIINLSSMAGKSTFPFQSLYHTSKWAVEGLSEGLQYEMEKLNIRVKIVEPGMVKTNLYDSIKNTSLDDFPQDYRDGLKNWYNFLKGSFDKGNSPELTAKIIYMAATDHKAKLRYVSGMDTKMVFLLRSVLPLRMLTKIIRKMTRV